MINLFWLWSTPASLGQFRLLFRVIGGGSSPVALVLVRSACPMGPLALLWWPWLPPHLSAVCCAALLPLLHTLLSLYLCQRQSVPLPAVRRRRLLLQSVLLHLAGAGVLLLALRSSQRTVCSAADRGEPVEHGLL